MTTKKENTKKVEKREVKDTKLCKICQINKPITQYYKSSSPLDPDKLLSVCKPCINEKVDVTDIESIKNMLLQLNKPYLHTHWFLTVQETQRRGFKEQAAFGLYLKNVYMNFKDMTWRDSEFTPTKEDELEAAIPSSTLLSINVAEDLNEDKNRQDVVRMVGYDPFEFENEIDKRHLYNKLVDFLDESTLEDSFKLPAVIEIVKTFNQLDKINSAIASITSDAKTVAQNVGNVKSLTDAKEKMLKNVLALAKDNGISVNHNNNKSKGSGTLSGIMKQLQEKGFREAEVNVFDVETSAGMLQVAEISHRSILNQLQFDENDYTNMIHEQKQIIYEMESKLHKLEEENRLLKIRIKDMG